MRTICLIVIVLTLKNSNIRAQQWQAEASTTRGRMQYYAGAIGPASTLGYSVRSDAGGGWMWQFVDYTNNSFFNVKYPNGYVGLGVDNPLAKLHISNANAREALRVYLDGNTSNYLSMWQGSGAAAIDPIGTGKIYIGYDLATDIYLSANGGKVGVGTTTFGNEKLSIVSANQWQIRLRDSGSGGGDWRIGATSNSWGVTNGKFVISNSDLSANAAFVIDNSNNVGIGTVSPTSRLEVVGPATGSAPTIRAAGGGDVVLSSGGSLFLDGNYSYATGNYIRPIGGNNTQGFFTSGQQRMRINPDGKIGIGTGSPTELLTVNGKVHAKEIIVDLSVPGPDYVFEKSYDLMSLDEVRKYIDTHKHLSDVPSAKQMENEGLKLGEMDMVLLKKVEELTLYIIQLNERLDRLEKENKRLKKRSKA